MASAEHKDNGSHILLDDSSLKTNAIIEDLKLARKTSRKIKKKKQCEAGGPKDKGSHFSLNDSSLNIDATSKEENSLWKQKREGKKEKQGKSVEHADKGFLVSPDNSSLKTDATKEVNLSRKRKRERKKKKKQGKDIEHKDNGSHLLVDDSSLKTDATSKEVNSSHTQEHKKDTSSHVSLDNSSLKIDATTEELNSSRKRKRKRKKKKHGKAIEHKPNGSHLLVDNSSLKTDATIEDPLHEPPAPTLLDSQETAELSLKKKNKRRKRKKAKQHAIENIVNGCGLPNDTFSSKSSAPALNRPAELDCIDTTRDDVLCAAGDVTGFSLVSKTGGQSEIPHIPLDRTITTCKHYSKNKLLILDVNGLLADFVIEVPKGSKPPDFNINKKKVYKRPFCVDFIKFCLDKFHVGVWSSRVKHNLDRAIEFLFGKSASKLLFCWNQSHCTKTKSSTLEDKHKPLVFKDLRKLWDKTVPNLPWEKGEFNESNTLLLDDSPYKALLNPRYTAIFPHSYHFDNTDDRSLAHGGDLRVYLKGLAMAENVQEYVSANPFGQEPITETSPSWDFYSKIIEAVKRRQNDAVIQANSSSQRRGNQSSTAMDEGDAGQPPSAVGAPPQLTEAPPPLTAAAD